jgi:hypothetical protein
VAEEELPGSEEERLAELEEWQPVSSSMVAEVSFSGDQIGVIFNSGSEASFTASLAQFEELLQATSIGRWMWENFGDELHRGRTSEA